MYCRMLQGEHSAILLTFIKLPFVFESFVLSIFELPFYTGITVCPITSALSRYLLNIWSDYILHDKVEKVQKYISGVMAL